MNAIYTPNPKCIEVVVYRADDGEVRAAVGPTRLVARRGDVIRTEMARVTGRGNLWADGNTRWYEVTLTDGSRHMVAGYGS